MIKTSIHERGFSIIEAILIVVVMAVLGGMGWFAYSRQHQASKSPPIVLPRKAQQQYSAQSKASGVAATNSSARYLVIKEWGIKVKFSDADKATYTIDGNANGSANADGVVSVATIRLNDSFNTTEKCKDIYPLTQYSAAAQIGTVKIGNFAYGHEGPSTYDPCGDRSVDSLREKIYDTELADITKIIYQE